jgi:predicted transposase/invertase (TIGR01784 family)
MNRLDAIPEEFKGSIFERMFELGRIDILTPVEMEAYNKSILAYSDVRDVADCAREEGMEKGMKKGMERGMEKGMEKERIEFTKKCLRKGMSFEEIAELTEFSLDQIKAWMGIN